MNKHYNTSGPNYPVPPATPKQNGHFVNRATAMVMADLHEEYKVQSWVRNLLRAVVVLCVIGAVIAFTAVKYATDDTLRRSTVTVREEDYKSLSQDTIEVALCPCRNDTFAWSVFVTYSAPLSTNSTEIIDFCAKSIVPELASTPQPAADATLAEQTAYNALLEEALTNSGTLHACTQAVTDILIALDPARVVRNSGLGDNFYNTELLSSRQARQRIDIFIGNKVRNYLVQSRSSLTLDRVTLSRLQANLTQEVVNFEGTQEVAVALTSVAAVFEMYTNATNEVLGALQEKSGDRDFLDRLTGAIEDAIAVDYVRYREACKPFYCDFTTTKNAWARVTEFLGLLGGLWTTFLGVGLVAWFFLDFVLPAPPP